MWINIQNKLINLSQVNTVELYEDGDDWCVRFRCTTFDKTLTFSDEAKAADFFLKVAEKVTA